jgi:hypothetical protein
MGIDYSINELIGDEVKGRCRRRKVDLLSQCAGTHHLLSSPNWRPMQTAVPEFQGNVRNSVNPNRR